MCDGVNWTRRSLNVSLCLCLQSKHGVLVHLLIFLTEVSIINYHHSVKALGLKCFLELNIDQHPGSVEQLGAFRKHTVFENFHPTKGILE